MFNRRQIVIETGAAHVAVGIFTPLAGGKLRLEEFARQPRSPDPSHDAASGESVTLALTTAASALSFHGLAALVVPGHLTWTRYIRTPVLAAAQRAEVVRFEAGQSIPQPMADVVWDHRITADDGQELEIMLSAAKREVVESLCDAAEGAGLPIRRAEASCLGLYRSFRFNYPAISVPVAVLDIGARSSTMLLIAPGGRLFSRTLALAGNTITLSVAGELGLDFARAEALKIQVLSAAVGTALDPAGQAAVDRATCDFIDRLQLEVMRTIGNFSLRSGAAKPSVLFLTGGCSLVPGLNAKLAGKFSIPVERFDPRRNVELSPTARSAKAESFPEALVNLIGLAAPVAGAERGNFGLLPPKLRAEAAFRRRQPALVAALALVALALVPPLWHYHRVAQWERARRDQLQAQLGPLQATSSNNSANLAKLVQTRKEIATLNEVVAARSTWVRFLAELQERLGTIGDVWLDQLSVLPATPVTKLAGGTTDPARPKSWQLRLSGRLLDPRNPMAKVSSDSYARVKQLLSGLAGSPFVAAVEDERFDNSQPGLLRFEVTLTVNRQHPL